MDRIRREESRQYGISSSTFFRRATSGGLDAWVQAIDHFASAEQLQHQPLTPRRSPWDCCSIEARWNRIALLPGAGSTPRFGRGCG
jgi:hypothetical protein